MNAKTKKLIFTALFVALTCVLTMFPKLPWGGGYVHAGDSMILLCALMLGGPAGFLAGAVGSCLADLFSGYALYAVFTLIVKGILGFAVGRFACRETSAVRRTVYCVLGMAVMVVGYFMADLILYHNFVTAAYNVLGNLIQGAASIVIALLLYPAIARIWKDSSFSSGSNVIK